MSWFKRPGMLKGELRVGSPARQSPARQSPARPTANQNVPRPVDPPQPAMVGRPRSGTDPETCLEVFRSHWLQAVTIMNKTNGAPASARRSGLAEEVSAVRQHVDQMALLLLEEEGAGADGAGQGPVLQYTLQEDVFAKLLTWAGRVGEHGGTLRMHQLKVGRGGKLYGWYRWLSMRLLQCINNAVTTVLSWAIDARTKWPTFSRQQFRMYFL